MTKVLITLIPILIILVILGAAAYAGWYFFMKLRLKIVSSNEVGVVTGTNLGDPKKEPNIVQDTSGRYMKIIRGGGHRLKMFQSFDRIPLQSFQLKFETPKVYTSEGVGVYGQAVATVKVSDEINGIVQYAEQFLGKKSDQIAQEIEEILGGNLRAILSKMTVEEINSDRDKFNESVRSVAQEQLDRMGFFITSLVLIDLRDDDGYLENLGKPQVAKIKKIADIAEAESHRETEIKQAEVDEQVAKEKYQRQMSIAEAKKQKDLNDARILSETEKERAIAEAAYDLEQEQRRFAIEKQKLEIREQEKINELKLREMERENEVKLQERQVQLEEKQVQVRKQQADAEFYAKVRQAEADAEAKKLEGEVEAEVIRKRSAAEVEALEARAEAMAKHKEVLITEKLIDVLPKYAQAVSSSLNNVESIRILDGGNGDQVRSLPNMVTGMMTNMNEGLGQMTGLNLNEIVENLSKPNQHTNNYNSPQTKLGTEDDKSEDK